MYQEYTNEKLKTTTTIYQNYKNNFLTYLNLNIFIDLISINENKRFKLIFIINNFRNTFKSILLKQISTSST